MNQPRPVQVTVEAGMPVALIEHGYRQRVVQVEDSWLLEDEWWREPIRRRYFCLLLEGGILRTVFHDLTTDTWFGQAY